MEELIKINLERACRSCLIEEGEMENVFSIEENSQFQLKDKIINCTRIEVHQNDGLPKQICTTCSLKISQAYEFKIQFERSDSKLREYIANLSNSSGNSITQQTKNVPASNFVIDFNSHYTTESNMKTKNKNSVALESDEIAYSRESIKSFNANCDQGLSDHLDINEKCTQTEDSFLDIRNEHLESHKKCFLNSETFFENVEMLYTEPDINVLEHLEFKQEPDDESDNESDYDNAGYNNTSSPPTPVSESGELEASDQSDPSDVEFKPYKKIKKQAKRKIITKKRGRPKKCLNNYNEGLEVIKIKASEIGDDTKIINADPVSGKFHCTVCDKKLNSLVGLTIHLRKHTGERLHKCPLCEKTFTRSNHMKRHQLTHSSIKPYKCAVCDKGFTRLDHLNMHMFTHMDKKPFECDICNKGFNKRNHLDRHKEAMHGDKTLNLKTEFCEICKKGFTTAKYLRVHMKLHADGKSYTCKFCAIVFNTRPELAEHLKTHSNEKPFMCSECGQRFIRNDYLRTHMRRHRGEKPYICRYCGKGFPRSTDRTVHERYHTGEKPHLCTVCGKRFHRPHHLVVHTRIHTGEKPYVCSHCGKAFTQGNDLKIHERRHTGEQ